MSHDLLINKELKVILCPICGWKCILAVTDKKKLRGGVWIRVICPECGDIKTTLSGIKLELDEEGR